MPSRVRPAWPGTRRSRPGCGTGSPIRPPGSANSLLRGRAVPCPLRHPAQPPLDHLAHRLRQTQPLETPRHAPSPAVAYQRALLQEMQEHRPDEERIPARLPSEGGDEVPRHLVMLSRSVNRTVTGPPAIGRGHTIPFRLPARESDRVAHLTSSWPDPWRFLHLRLRWTCTNSD